MTRARAIIAVGPSAYKWTTGRARRRRIELYRVYKLPVFLRPRDDSGRRPADERSGAESIVSDGPGCSGGCEGYFGGEGEGLKDRYVCEECAYRRRRRRCN